MNGLVQKLARNLFSKEASKNVPAGAPGGVEGKLVYSIGDIHGRYDLMRTMLGELRSDYLVQAQGRRPILIFCGDYVDRGPYSAHVVEALVQLQQRDDLEVRTLKGNHEQALLAFLQEPLHGSDWLGFGGAETLLSYGVPPPTPADGPDGLRKARDELLGRMPSSHLLLLQNLELMVVVGDYAFVHAGVRPGVPLARQAEADLLWIRRDFVGFEGRHEKIIVHGHTWIDDQPQVTPHRIGIDTGAYATGVLTAVRLQDGALDALQVGLPKSPAA